MQYFNPGLRLTPIMVTGMDFHRMVFIADHLGKIMSEYISLYGLKLGKNIIILISSDANHYGNVFRNIPSVKINKHISMGHQKTLN